MAGSLQGKGFEGRRANAVPRGIASATSIVVDRALNAHVWDRDGREYIDFAGGIAVLNTGHCHPRVIAAVQAQLGRFTHSAFQVAGYDCYIELAERLNRLVPVDGPARTVLFTTGAEAVENAVKIARAATARPGVIAFSGGFHGRTALTMGLTGKVAPYKRQFGPSPAGIHHAPFPIPHHGEDVATALAGIDRIFRADIDPSDVAAVIVEPVQGEGGFHPVPPDMMAALRRICDTHGIVLIADEVQTGFARTGRMFAMDHHEVRADIVTMAKSLAGGLPLSAVTGRSELMDSVDPGGLGGTYGGSPVGCAAALAVLDVIEAEQLCDRAQTLGDRARRHLQRLAERAAGPRLAHVRGLGSMIAFDVVDDAGRPDGAAARRVVGACVERGLILLSCGVHGETIRLLYPLTIDDATFEAGFARLRTALADCAGTAAEPDN